MVADRARWFRCGGRIVRPRSNAGAPREGARSSIAQPGGRGQVVKEIPVVVVAGSDLSYKVVAVSGKGAVQWARDRAGGGACGRPDRDQHGPQRGGAEA